MQYDSGKHCVFYHRYHLVWSTKYRSKILQGDIRLRVRDICRQVCSENGVDIMRGVLSSDHVYMFVSVPPKLAISDLMRLHEEAVFPQSTARIPATEKAILGTPLLGQGVFFDHQRCDYRGHRTSVLREAHRKSYRRQTVVV